MPRYEVWTTYTATVNETWTLDTTEPLTYAELATIMADRPDPRVRDLTCTDEAIESRAPRRIVLARDEDGRDVT